MNRPEQIQLPLFFPTVQVPQGDGSILLKPGRPVSYFTPKQFGQLVELSADTICRHIRSECLPEKFVEYIGPRKIRIRVDGMDHFREYWKGRRGAGA